jgi:hypothetical protein
MTDGVNSIDSPTGHLALPSRPRVPLLQLQCDANGRLMATMEAGGPSEFAAMFGGVSREFADQAIQDMLNVVLTASPKPGSVDTATVNALLQAVGGVRPTDEIEAMLAVQLASFHHVTLYCLRRSQQATATLEGRALNLGQANKCARTFATLLDALARHRGKCTTQRVIVENVTVEAGGQAVVGAVSAGAGRKGKVQPHATASKGQDRRGRRPPLPRPDPTRAAVPTSGGAR